MQAKCVVSSFERFYHRSIVVKCKAFITAKATQSSCNK